MRKSKQTLYGTINCVITNARPCVEWESFERHVRWSVHSGIADIVLPNAPGSVQDLTVEFRIKSCRAANQSGLSLYRDVRASLIDASVKLNTEI